MLEQNHELKEMDNEAQDADREITRLRQLNKELEQHRDQRDKRFFDKEGKEDGLKEGLETGDVDRIILDELRETVANLKQENEQLRYNHLSCINNYFPSLLNNLLHMCSKALS